MPSVENCISSLEEATAYFEKAVEDAKSNSGGRRTVDGFCMGSVLKYSRECADDTRGIKENQERYKCCKSIVRSPNPTKVPDNIYHEEL